MEKSSPVAEETETVKSPGRKRKAGESKKTDSEVEPEAAAVDGKYFFQSTNN